jgi:(p)ppGpp synthase/HD superfamily hydrolase
MLDKAINIAAKAHQGQADKGGNPYILHPLRVMFSRKTEIERICAVLHDVIEDTDITLVDLRNEGFSEEVIAAIDALTKRNGESYDDFIERVIKNKIAARVKLNIGTYISN